MSGSTFFYAEYRGRDGSWHLAMDGAKPAIVFEWANRSFEQWVLDGIPWHDDLGPAPRAYLGYPESPSIGLSSQEMEKELTYCPRVGWMWLSDLLGCSSDEIQRWIAEQVEPGLREFDLDRNGPVRLILATD